VGGGGGWWMDGGVLCCGVQGKAPHREKEREKERQRWGRYRTNHIRKR